MKHQDFKVLAVGRVSDSVTFVRIDLQLVRALRPNECIDQELRIVKMYIFINQTMDDQHAILPFYINELFFVPKKEATRAYSLGKHST